METYISGEIPTTGKSPQARFGHTIILVTKTKACLFGGATGNAYTVTNDTFTIDFSNIPLTWKQLDNVGSIPIARAAHACIANESNHFFLFGGAVGNGVLTPENLYYCDLKSEDKAQWIDLPIVGACPQKRYGHAMAFTKPYVIIFGGNTGNTAVNDVWTLNIDRSPYSWSKIDLRNDSPMARVYHAGALCMSGLATYMIVVFGGRSAAGEPLNDSWGLRRHRDGKWDWVRAPNKDPKIKLQQRHQHSCLFLGSLLFVIGGRGINGAEPLQLEVYDTETSEWVSLIPIPRFRHAAWIIDNYIYIYGGFSHDNQNDPKGSLICIDILKVLEKVPHFQTKASQIIALNMKASSPYTSPMMSPNITPSISPTNNAGMQQNNNKNMTFSQNKPNSKILEESKVQQESYFEKSTSLSSNSSRGNKLNEKVFVVTHEDIKVANSKKSDTSKMTKNISEGIEIAIEFLNILMQPATYINYPENSKFQFSSDKIIKLCDHAQNIIEKQPMVLRPCSPIKIFGDIHGQYSDLMRFFDLFGSPCEGGVDKDIESFDYLFLGDFVDRGNHSLETICLLLALKVKHPEQVHLIRGNHEDLWINNSFGFADECANRLDEDVQEEESVFRRINQLFEYLPLMAVVDKKVACLHGGIGTSLQYIEQLEQLKRPLEVIHEVQTEEQQLIVDILWSDPTDSDQDLGIHPNTIRDPQGTGNIVKFGPDRVKNFLTTNNLGLIIRAHECVMDGFERFAGGSLITVFSATDYCGKHKNAGAVLIIGKNSEITPKLIYPSSMSSNNWIEDEEELKKRPPTPPRWRSGALTYKQQIY